MEAVGKITEQATNPLTIALSVECNNQKVEEVVLPEKEKEDDLSEFVVKLG